MAPAKIRGKIRNDNAKIRFTSDLLQSIHKASPFDKSISLGNRLSLGDILDNSVTKGSGRYLEFSGVLIHYNDNGVIFIRGVYKDDDTGQNITQSLSPFTHGIKHAFLEAVKFRAKHCGYVGPIPDNLLYIPTADELVKYAIATKGEAWVERHSIKDKLNEVDIASMY